MSDFIKTPQSDIVQAFAYHPDESEITMLLEDGMFPDVCHRLTIEDVDNAYDVMLDTLGLADYPKLKTAGLRALTREYFLNPEFHSQFPGLAGMELEDKPLNSADGVCWPILDNLHAATAKYLTAQGDSLQTTHVDLLFAFSRIPPSKRPEFLQFIERELCEDFKRLSLDTKQIGKILEFERTQNYYYIQREVDEQLKLDFEACSEPDDVDRYRCEEKAHAF